MQLQPVKTNATMENMQQARKLYQRFGFEYLDQPLGDTGHTSCSTWMVRDLEGT